jgi:PPM family protein phosphatase
VAQVVDGADRRAFAFAVNTAQVRGFGQDRYAVLGNDEQVVVLVADGAGGSGDGAAAAETILGADAVAANKPFDASAMLVELARVGETTAVVLTVTRDRVFGASVGDSEAWLVRAGDAIELTTGQSRKPLVGAGCTPFAINGPAPGDGTLVIASDGLFRYAKRDDIIRIAAGADLDLAARALIAR